MEPIKKEKPEKIKPELSYRNLRPVIEQERKFCSNCGIEIFGRAGKMFCSDYCRNTWNNRQNKDATNLVRNINNRLRKNYRILQELNPDKETRVERKVLKKKGFNFEFFTSIFQVKTGKDYFFVYDQGFLQLDDDVILLLKKEL